MLFGKGIVLCLWMELDKKGVKKSAAPPEEQLQSLLPVTRTGLGWIFLGKVLSPRATRAPGVFGKPSQGCPGWDFGVGF